MKRYTLAVLSLIGACAQAPEERRLELRYDSPATEWTEALPVGNGRLGAMVFGGVAEERIQFNEDTVWQGEPHSYARSGAVEVLPEIRRLLWEERQADAEQLALERFMSVPLRQKAYQAFGDLNLSFPSLEGRPAESYRRGLDLDEAVAWTELTVDGARVRREVLASFPDQVLAIRIASDEPLSFAASLTSAHAGSGVSEVDGDLVLSGSVSDSAIRFEARLAATSDGQARVDGNRLLVEDATEAMLLLGGATNFVDFRDVSADPTARNAATLTAVQGKSWSEIRSDHLRDHQEMFRRVDLDLGRTEAADAPTDQRIASFATGEGPTVRGTGLPIRPLPADRIEPGRRSAGEPPRSVERLEHAVVG